MRAALAFVFLMVLGSAALAVECPPEVPAGVACLDPADTVMLEHADRTERLKRLSGGTVDFTFVEDHISGAELGLGEFPDGLPILRVIADQDVFFDSGSDVIRPEAFRLVDIIARNLRSEVSDVAVFVAGHTDSDGAELYNRDLGLRRAMSVASSLARSGIYQAAIYRVSFGELMPIASNASARGKARNRRVEFLFAARPKAITAYIEDYLPIAPCAEASDDPIGSCLVAIDIPIVRVTIPKDSEARVIRLDQVAREVEANQTLTPIEAKQARQEIEHERERIPIEVHEERVPIQLTLQ